MLHEHLILDDHSLRQNHKILALVAGFYWF
jgi:hypothetical protein